VAQPVQFKTMETEALPALIQAASELRDVKASRTFSLVTVVVTKTLSVVKEVVTAQPDMLDGAVSLPL
jgi:ABC-type sulfate transport system permease component